MTNLIQNILNSLPDFIKTKMQSSTEYRLIGEPNHAPVYDNEYLEPVDDLPF